MTTKRRVYGTSFSQRIPVTQEVKTSRLALPVLRGDWLNKFCCPACGSTVGYTLYYPDEFYSDVCAGCGVAEHYMFLAGDTE